MTVQEQALNTKAVAHEIYYQDPICRLCKQLAETVGHTIRGRSKLAESKYTERHNNVALIAYRAIYTEYNLERTKRWWLEPEK